MMAAEQHRRMDEPGPDTAAVVSVREERPPHRRVPPEP